MADYQLQMQNINKAFPGVQALDGAHFDLKHGEVHALLGMNGAGKSTLIKILSGVYQKDGGTIVLAGQEVQIKNPQHAMKLGIATVYQDPQMIPSFTGYENIFLGFESTQKGPFSKINRTKLRARAEKMLEGFPVDVNLNRPVSELEAVDQEIIAILRAISREMSVLVLDEPTSILTEKEKNVLFRMIKALKEEGRSIIFITHRLEEIYQISDRLTIFRDGRNVVTLKANDERANPMSIAELMLGKKMETIYPEKCSEVGQEVLKVRDLSLEGSFAPVDFSVRKGEILGIFGLVGSGVEELAKVLFGAYKRTSGTIELNAREVWFNTPSEAIKSGLFMVPGDRRVEGLIAIQTMYFNVSLANLDRVSTSFGLLKGRSEKREVLELVERLAVTPPQVDLKVSMLSGGNQQKVVICKGLFTQANVYIFVEPTTGVDVGAKAAIYKLMRELSRHAGVILISSDCTEVFGVSDYSIVLFKGRTTMSRETCKLREEEMLLCGVKGKDNE